jgi:hypothetical protein
VVEHGLPGKTRQSIQRWPPQPLTVSNAIPKQWMALLNEASEVFEETGCVPGMDGEPVLVETIVPDAKKYISGNLEEYLI